MVFHVCMIFSCFPVARHRTFVLFIDVYGNISWEKLPDRTVRSLNFNMIRDLTDILE